MTMKPQQETYNSAEDALKGTNVEQLQKNLEKANADVTADQKKVDKAKAAKNIAETNKVNADAAVAAVEKKQKQSAADVNAKQTATDQTQSKLNTANADLKQAQDKTQKLSDQLSSVNTITLPSGYSDALKAYFNYHGQSNWSESVDNSLSKAVAKYRDTAFNENHFKIIRLMNKELSTDIMRIIGTLLSTLLAVIPMMKNGLMKLEMK